MYAFDANATAAATTAPLEWKLEVAAVRESAKGRITESVEEVRAESTTDSLRFGVTWRAPPGAHGAQRCGPDRRG